MSHVETADKLLIKPAAGARPAPPRTRGRSIPKARTGRPVTRRVTRGTATTRLATAPDRPTRRVLPSPEKPRFWPSGTPRRGRTSQAHIRAGNRFRGAATATTRSDEVSSRRRGPRERKHHRDVLAV